MQHQGQSPIILFWTLITSVTQLCGTVKKIQMIPIKVKSNVKERKRHECSIFSETIYFLTREQHPEEDLVEKGYL